MPPGKEGKISLAMEHTDGYAGEVAKSAAVVTNDPARSNFTLVLHVFFKAPPSPAASAAPNSTPTGKLSGPFTVSPSNRWISSVLSGGTATSRLTFYNRETRPIHITKVVAEGNDFIASLNTIEDGKRYELIVSTHPGLKVGQHGQMIKLLTDDAENPEIPVEVEVNVFPMVFATPTAISLPRTSLTADFSSLNLPTIYVRKLRVPGLKIKSASSSIPFIKLTLGTETEGQVYTIRLSLDKSKLTTAGEYRGKIVIETNDFEVPMIEVSVQCSFIP